MTNQRIAAELRKWATSEGMPCGGLDWAAISGRTYDALREFEGRDWPDYKNSDHLRTFVLFVAEALES